MSLIDERDFEIWAEAAHLADLSGLLDLHDQASVVGDTDPVRALALKGEIGNTALSRMAEGTLEPHIVDQYFRLTTGYLTD